MMERNVESGRRVTQVTLWFGLLGSAIAWLLHLVVIYTVAEAACVTGFPWFHVLGIHGGSLLIVVFTLLMLALAAVSGYVAHWNRRQLEQRPNGQKGPVDRGVGQHMARVGWYLGAIFIFIIASETLPVFFLHPCP